MNPMIRSALTRCRRPAFQGFLATADAFSVCLAPALFAGSLGPWAIGPPGGRPPGVFRLMLLVALLVAVYSRCGLYEIRRRWSLGHLALATLFGAASVTALFFACCHMAGDAIVRSAFFSLFIYTAGSALAIRLAAREMVRWFNHRGMGVKRVVVIGDNDVADTIRRKVESNPMAGLALVGQAVPSHPAASPRAVVRSGGMDIVKDELLACFPDRVLFAVDIAQHEELQELAEFCLSNDIEVLQVPYLHHRYRGQVAARELLGMPFLGLGGHSLDGWELVTKSIVDRALAGAMLLLLSPLMLLLSIAIRLGASTAILRRHRRIGKGGVPFNLLRFETTGPDGRRHLLGEVIARNGLHRLPELFSVLRGDMSLVGPEADNPARASRLNDWQRARLSVRPGITGLAQIRSRRISSGMDRARCDQEYIDLQGPVLDLRILGAWALAFCGRRLTGLVRRRTPSKPASPSHRSLPQHEVAR